MNIKGIVKEGTTPAAIIIELKMLPVSRPMELPHKQHINAISKFEHEEVASALIKFYHPVDDEGRDEGNDDK